MRFRLWVAALALAFVGAGCISSGPSLLSTPVTLYSESELTADGPALQPVTVRAVRRDGQPVSFENLQVSGRKRDGTVTPVDWSLPAQARDAVTENGFAEDIADVAEELDFRTYERDHLTFFVDVAELVAQGVTEIELVLDGSTLALPIRGTHEGADTGGEAEEVEAEVDEADAFEWDHNGDYDADGDGPPYPGDAMEPDDGRVSALAPASQTRFTRVLRAGTSQATTAYIIRSSRPGPTVVIVGGMHGSETAGWRAAGEIKDWSIDRGTLVVIPQANRPAVLRSRRTGPDGIDLNRQFPVGAPPRTALAREIWNLVREFRPVALMDLHEGWGLRRLGHRFPGGTLSVGQTLITYPAKDARRFALAATRYVDTRHVGNSRTYSFMNIGPPVAGSLARKAGAELNIPAFIVEPSQHNTTLATRIRWHKAFVEQLLKWYGLVDNRRVIVPPYVRAARPTETAPAVFGGGRWPNLGVAA